MPDLFNRPADVTHPKAPCPCGSIEFKLTPGTGPHAAGLRCMNCNRFYCWISKAEMEIYRDGKAP